MRKWALLLVLPAAIGCHTEVQPIVIDLTAGRTPTAAPSPAPTATFPAAAPKPTPPPEAAVASPPSPPATAAPAAGAIALTPEEIVQAQIDAYNRGDLEAFLSFYAADARLYAFPDRLTEAGRDRLRRRYAEEFAETTRLRTTVLRRMTHGNFVVDQREVSSAPGGPRSAIAVYQVREGKIANVWLIR